ncbi:Prenyltransferase/squalene oxidase [Syntrophobotulus glycolicus DSM 8271]|uniref:Prenyltransferase/squalene oxidase n=1 Tax=Syntrophobotulus glycolicus (strain DSM 8271 / FlGlyR) TaxID=645991 RepID=F0T2V6_SYNGF|nr:prenyltransferase/squalene oxidase repeat-containing protein [Syntrophobotulus glycolicus]ADY57593.1 Prenyltransferase/squalene oxidase [Syntrophobotulus glycolicus DSM 8271]
MERLSEKINESVKLARDYVLEGGEQILNGRLDEAHKISISTGATALATLAQFLLGNQYQDSHQAGLKWLQQNRRGKGWSKVPNGDPDLEITRLVQKVLLGSQSRKLVKFLLPSQSRELANLVLSLGQKVVSGMEGPLPDETSLPNILTEKVLNKLPPYGRPVVIAASLLAVKNLDQSGVSEAIVYLCDCRMKDGSWCEDIVATSLATIALIRAGVSGEQVDQAGQWLKSKQYSNGAWPAFDQLLTWSTGLAIQSFIQFPQSSDERDWLNRAAKWLAARQNTDGSFGSTPPFAQPDLDDTAIALMGLQHFNSKAAHHCAELLRRLQNKDGSWSTFPSFKGVPPALECTFPVYIPSTDVTIHVLDGLWGMPGRNSNIEVAQGLHWLLEQQLPSGEIPGIWYEGPIYATAQALELLNKWSNSWRRWRSAGQIFDVQRKAYQYLLSLQNSDGSWGSSVTETSLALSALSYAGSQLPPDIYPKGLSSIISSQLTNGSFQPSYQGIYAKGWDYEEPLTTALTAIRALERYRLLLYRHS